MGLLKPTDWPAQGRSQRKATGPHPPGAKEQAPAEGHSVRGPDLCAPSSHPLSKHRSVHSLAACRRGWAGGSPSCQRRAMMVAAAASGGREAGKVSPAPGPSLDPAACRFTNCPPLGPKPSVCSTTLPTFSNPAGLLATLSVLSANTGCRKSDTLCVSGSHQL